MTAGRGCLVMSTMEYARSGFQGLAIYNFEFLIYLRVRGSCMCLDCNPTNHSHPPIALSGSADHNLLVTRPDLLELLCFHLSCHPWKQHLSQLLRFYRPLESLVPQSTRPPEFCVQDTSAAETACLILILGLLPCDRQDAECTEAFWEVYEEVCGSAASFYPPERI